MTDPTTAPGVQAAGSATTKPRSRSIPPDVKHAVWTRDRGVCQRCGHDSNILPRCYGALMTRVQGVCALDFLRSSHTDHIVPFSRGGGHDLGNLRTLCLPCHGDETSRLHRTRGKEFVPVLKIDGPHAKLRPHLAALREAVDNWQSETRAIDLLAPLAATALGADVCGVLLTIIQYDCENFPELTLRARAALLRAAREGAA